MTQNLLNLISLALLLPTALALPFDWLSLKAEAYKEATAQFDAPQTHPYWSYTLTATSGATYPTAAVAPINHLFTTTTGTGTGTATAGPTATGYVKRGLEERHFPHSYPTAFPTATFPHPTAGYPTGYSYPTAAFSSVVNEVEELVDSAGLKEKRAFAGPRRPHGKWSMHWDMLSTSASAVAPTATGSTGYVGPTATSTAVPTYGW
ncbi:hypothetical protein LTS10_008462 [Elasticomyces elasticus]|nr:hypothetical protein LTS10_008462 [Elasticomyces elasticus]